VQYFVIGDDGQKYGPADLATLNAWIAEGRLLANTILEDSRSGARTPASAVPGLQFAPPAGGGYQAPGGGYRPPQGGYQAPQGGYQAPGGPQFGTNYPRQQMGDNGSGDITQAWVFAVLSLFCCGLIFGILGLNAAKRAEQKGNPGAQAAKIANIVCLSIWALAVIVQIFSGIAAFNSAR